MDAWNGCTSVLIPNIVMDKGLVLFVSHGVEIDLVGSLIRLYLSHFTYAEREQVASTKSENQQSKLLQSLARGLFPGRLHAQAELTSKAAQINQASNALLSIILVF